MAEPTGGQIEQIDAAIRQTLGGLAVFGSIDSLAGVQGELAEEMTRRPMPAARCVYAGSEGRQEGDDSLDRVQSWVVLVAAESRRSAADARAAAAELVDRVIGGLHNTLPAAAGAGTPLVYRRDALLFGDSRLVVYAVEFEMSVRYAAGGDAGDGDGGEEE